MASNTEMRPPAGRRQLVDEVLRCLVFAIELALFGLAGSLVPLLMVVAYKLAPGTLEKFDVDMQAKEAVILVSERRPGSLAYSVLVYNAWMVLYVPYMLVPCMFALVIVSNGAQIAAVISSTCAAMALFCYVVVTPGVPENLSVVFIQAPFFALVVVLVLFYPRKGRLWVLGLLLVAACAAGQFLSLAVSQIPPAERQLLITCLIIPATRELGVMPMRLLARLMDNMDREATGVCVRRDLTWGFALVFQVCFSSASRFMTASIVGPYKVLSILLQAVMEIVTRLTMTRRDKIVARYLGVKSHVQRVSAAQSSSAGPELYKRETSQSAVGNDRPALTAANMINAEMLGEYVAIVFQMVSLLVLREMPLALSMQAFAVVEPPFAELLPVSGIIAGTVGMLVTEIAVDTICVVVEHRRIGFDLPQTWRSIKPASKLLMIAMAAYSGGGISMLGVKATRDTRACSERNICLCASGRGLRSGSLEQAYCAEMYPPSGRPGGVHIYFALETPSRIEWPRRRLDKELLANDGSFPLPLHLLGDMEVDLSSSGDDLTSATRALIGTYTSGETPTLAVVVSERAAPGGSLSGRPCDGETLSVLALPSLNGTALRAQVSLWLNLSACDLDDCEAWALSNWECDRSSPQPIFGSDNNLP